MFPLVLVPHFTGLSRISRGFPLLSQAAPSLQDSPQNLFSQAVIQSKVRLIEGFLFNSNILESHPLSFWYQLVLC